MLNPNYSRKYQNGGWESKARISHNGNTAAAYLEVKDDCPDESQCELGVPIDDVFATNVDQLDFFITQEA